ncbi:hypothetical protein FWH13_00095 [Candidatus Saccharibacteria bacterium]|nr:hypothetical protein [Candidatus Saccharibacteria bacterium]
MQPKRRQFYVDSSSNSLDIQAYTKVIVGLAALLLLAIVVIVILGITIARREPLADHHVAAVGQNYFSLDDGSGFLRIGGSGEIPEGFTPGPNPVRPQPPGGPIGVPPAIPGPSGPDTGPGGGDPTDPPRPGVPCTIFNFSPEYCVEVEGHIMIASASLPIFARHDQDHSPRIAPGDSGSYAFTVLNNSNYVIAYRLFFEEINPQGINMRFRLRSGDVWLSGTEGDWVSATELGALVMNMPVLGATPYVLDWRWESHPHNDTAAGIASDIYTIRIISFSEQHL